MNLILISAEFPFGKGETFLENEVPILAQHFDKITIISLSENSEHTREIPSICEVFRYPVSLSKTEKILALRYLLLREVRAELKRVTSVYKLKVNFQIISTILVSWARAKKIKSLIRKHLNSESIAYSYWTDDSSLALAQLKILALNVYLAFTDGMSTLKQVQLVICLSGSLSMITWTNNMPFLMQVQIMQVQDGKLIFQIK